MPPVTHGIDRLPPLREVIARHGLSARRQLGQNFLLDLNLTAKIARMAGPLAGHSVLEIGPGPGGLTRSLVLGGAAKVVAVEKDARFLPALDEICQAAGGVVTVIHGDALKIDPAQLISPPARIVANLPYNIGTELLARWLSVPIWPPPWSSLTLAFQSELADRLVAGPGGKTYGRLSILAQWRCSVSIAMSLPSSAFVPPPKVESKIVHFECLPEPVARASPEILFRLVRSAFGHRRKMLRSSLKKETPRIVELLSAAGIATDARAESIGIAEYCALARKFEQLEHSPAREQG